MHSYLNWCEVVLVTLVPTRDSRTGQGFYSPSFISLIQRNVHHECLCSLRVCWRHSMSVKLSIFSHLTDKSHTIWENNIYMKSHGLQTMKITTSFFNYLPICRNKTIGKSLMIERMMFCSYKLLIVRHEWIGLTGEQSRNKKWVYESTIMIWTAFVTS